MRFVEWNPIVGCGPISPGCANCAAVAGAGAALKDKSGKAFSGVTRLDGAALGALASLAGSCAVFVCNHGDLFHAATPDHWLDAVFEIMEASPQHGFQVLTKRSARMRLYVTGRYGAAAAPAHIALGVSAERQGEFDVRVADLAATLAAVRYVTLYPLLERIDLTDRLRGISAVFAGEEAPRPADPDWFAAAATACGRAAVPFAHAPLLMGAA